MPSATKSTRFAVAVLALATLAAGGQAKQLFFENRINATIWVGSQGNEGLAPLNAGGWEMVTDSNLTLEVDDAWAGRFWGRTGCDAEGVCKTGNCDGLQCQGRNGQPPVTLAEFTFGGPAGQDFYHVSLADGFNLKVSIVPTAPSEGGYRCAPARCTVDINGHCPSELRLAVDGRTVGCKSACAAFDTDAYCCRGEHAKAEACRSVDWPHDYPQHVFKRPCPDANSYAHDEQKITFTCGNTGYKVIFG